MAAKRKEGQKDRGQGGNLRRLIDPILAKALAHPLRGHVLATLGDRVASPSEIGREVGIDARDLNYHFGVLVEIGLIKLAHTKKRRGVREHFYELNPPAVLVEDPGWNELPEPVRASLSASLLQIAVDDAVEALRAGTFNSRNSHQSRTTMILDEQGRNDVFELMQATLERVLEVGKQCSKSLKKRPEDGAPVEVFMMGFETAAAASRQADERPTPAR
jgi:DNA-binding transcriptional ArsR family regulator